MASGCRAPCDCAGPRRGRAESRRRSRVRRSPRERRFSRRRRGRGGCRPGDSTSAGRPGGLTSAGRHSSGQRSEWRIHWRMRSRSGCVGRARPAGDCRCSLTCSTSVRGYLKSDGPRSLVHLRRTCGPPPAIRLPSARSRRELSGARSGRRLPDAPRDANVHGRMFYPGGPARINEWPMPRASGAGVAWPAQARGHDSRGGANRISG